MVGGDDIDGFYGEPAPYDEMLEVELTLVEELPQAAQLIALPGLDDEWFGSFDDTKEIEREWEEEVPTTTWQRFGGWLRSIGRAA
jgi:hypothetical protein